MQIGEGAADDAKEHGRQRAGRRHQGHVGGRALQLEHDPDCAHRLHPGADVGDELGDPQISKGPVAKRRPRGEMRSLMVVSDCAHGLLTLSFTRESMSSNEAGGCASDRSGSRQQSQHGRRHDREIAQRGDARHALGVRRTHEPRGVASLRRHAKAMLEGAICRLRPEAKTPGDPFFLLGSSTYHICCTRYCPHSPMLTSHQRVGPGNLGKETIDVQTHRALRVA